MNGTKNPRLEAEGASRAAQGKCSTPVRSFDEELRENFAGQAWLLSGASAPDTITFKLRVENAQRQLRRQLFDWRERGKLPAGGCPLTARFIEGLSRLRPRTEEPIREAFGRLAEIPESLTPNLAMAIERLADIPFTDEERVLYRAMLGRRLAAIKEERLVG